MVWQPASASSGGPATVTGSKYVITHDERRFLVDAGVFQGERELRDLNWQPFPVPPASIETILITHAHTDHVGDPPVARPGRLRR